MTGGMAFAGAEASPSWYTYFHQALKKVSIGRRGSVGLSQEEVALLRDTDLALATPGIVKGAFLAGLLTKGTNEHEESLLSFFLRGEYAQHQERRYQVQGGNASLDLGWLTERWVSLWGEAWGHGDASTFCRFLLLEDAGYAAALIQAYEGGAAHVSVLIAIFLRFLDKKTLSEAEAVALGHFFLVESDQDYLKNGGRRGGKRERSVATCEEEHGGRKEISKRKEGAFSTGGEFMRGFAIATLRVRYETAEEWGGLYRALVESSSGEALDRSKAFSIGKRADVKRDIFTRETSTGATFRNVVREDFRDSGAVSRMIVMSEPMNGFTGSAFLSPVLAWWLQEYFKVTVVHLQSANPGPKFGFTLKELGTLLGMTTLGEEEGAGSLASSRDVMGLCVSLEKLSPGLGTWVGRRRDLVKRPAWATLEKFIRPQRILASSRSRLAYSDRSDGTEWILVTSAFHGPYVEKMIKLAQFAEYDAYIIVKWGVEGGLGASLSRPVQLFTGVRVLGDLRMYREKMFSFSYEDIAFSRRRDRRRVQDASCNEKLITAWFARYRMVEREMAPDGQSAGVEEFAKCSVRSFLDRSICQSSVIYDPWWAESTGQGSDEGENAETLSLDLRLCFAARVRLSLLAYTEAFKWIEKSLGWDFET